MSEEIKKEIEETTSESAQEAADQSLSRKRRTALVGYLAILFAVAFLLVALSMVIENKRLQSSKQKLEDKSAQTSASLNGKISELQNSYDTLKKQFEEQENELNKLRQEKDAWDAAVAELQKSVDDLTAERESLSDDLDARTAERDALQKDLDEAAAEKGALETELAIVSSRQQTLIEAAEKTAEVHELLYQAVEASDSGDFTALEALLEQIEPDADLLCPTAKDIYESLDVD